MDHLVLFTELEGWSDKEAHNEFRRDIAEFQISRGIWDQDDEDDHNDLILKFLAARPDRVAFNAENRQCVFQEFTRPMYSWEGSHDARRLGRGKRHGQEPEV